VKEANGEIAEYVTSLVGIYFLEYTVPGVGLTSFPIKKGMEAQTRRELIPGPYPDTRWTCNDNH
jgi:hypothetical protein